MYEDVRGEGMRVTGHIPSVQSSCSASRQPPLFPQTLRLRLPLVLPLVLHLHLSQSVSLFPLPQAQFSQLGCDPMRSASQHAGPEGRICTSNKTFVSGDCRTNGESPRILLAARRTALAATQAARGQRCGGAAFLGLTTWK